MDDTVSCRRRTARQESEDRLIYFAGGGTHCQNPFVRTGLTAAFFPDALLEACWCKPWRLWLLLSEVKREGRAPGRSVLRCEKLGIPWW